MLVVLAICTVLQQVNDISIPHNEFTEEGACAELRTLLEPYSKFDWHKGRAGSEPSYAQSKSIALVVTGHMLEWYFVLPVELQPPKETFSRSFLVLEKQLGEMTEEAFYNDFCPFTHAIVSINSVVSQQQLHDKPKYERIIGRALPSSEIGNE